MIDSEVNNFCNDLNYYLKHHFKPKKLITMVGFANTIGANSDLFDLYIRYKPTKVFWEENTLVIAGLSFSETRVGNGASLLHFFTQCSEKYSFKKIGIECAGYKASHFAAKYGFKEVKPAGNWIVSVENLKLSLTEYIKSNTST